MAFVCTLEPDSGHAEVFRQGNAFLVMIPVGYDDEEDKSYSLFISLDPRPGGDSEFTFCLIEYDGETDSEYLYWSGKEVARFIGRDDRALILASLLLATRHLLSAVQPATVHMCTVDTYPPPQAMRKNLLIARMFEMCGYRVYKHDPYHGQEVWRMERKVPPAIDEQASVPPPEGGGDEPRTTD